MTNNLLKEEILQDTKEDLPNSVLFVCNFNVVRSPIAEGLTKFLCGQKIFVDSVGIHDEKNDINPFSVAVMTEIGVDISKHQAKNFEQLNDGSFDLVITLTPEAHHRALDLTRFLSTKVEYWPTLDPSDTQGSRESILSSFRDLRDLLKQKIIKRFNISPTASSSLSSSPKVE